MRATARTGHRAAVLGAAGIALAGLLGACGTSAHGPSTATSRPEAAPVACGSWSTQETSSSPATQLAAQFGTIIECGFTGDTWLMVTAADTNPPAVKPGDPPPPSALWLRPQTLLVYPCAVGDQTCLDPASPHPTSGWQSVTAPTTGWLTLVGAPAPGALIFDVGSHQIWFDTRTQTWSTRPTASESGCAQAWSGAGGSSTAPISVQDSFLARHPQCAD
jgi:hypothetical protein